MLAQPKNYPCDKYPVLEYVLVQINEYEGVILARGYDGKLEVVKQDFYGELLELLELMHSDLWVKV